MVCQAMIIAMTVVLPAPVASFKARRINSGFASLLALARCSRKPLPCLPNLRDFGQPNCGFHRFHLAEEGADATEIMVPPMLQQALRFRLNQPVAGVLQSAPLLHMIAEFVDDWRRIVELFLGGKSLALVKDHGALIDLGFVFSGLGDGRDVLGDAAGFQQALGGLALFVKLPVQGWTLVR